MKDDRKKLLVGRSRALAMSERPDLPDPIRQMYKQAADSADTALGLQEALQRREQKLGQPVESKPVPEPSAKPEPQQASLFPTPLNPGRPPVSRSETRSQS